MNNWLSTETHLSLSRQKGSLSNIHIRPQCHCVLTHGATQHYRASPFGWIRAADVVDMILWMLALWSLLPKLSFSQRSGSFHVAVECRESCQLFLSSQGPVVGMFCAALSHRVSLVGWQIRSNRNCLGFFVVVVLYLYWWFQLNFHRQSEMWNSLCPHILCIYTLFVC